MAFANNQNPVAISVTASSGRVQLSASDGIAPSQKCLITNTSLPVAGGIYVGVKFGDSTVTAAFPTAGTAGGSALDAIIPAGGQVIVHVPKGATYVAAIGSAAGPTYTLFQLGYEAFP